MSSKYHQTVCSECEDEAEWYCVQDKADFCDHHNSVAHSLKSQKSHRVVSISEKENVLLENEGKPDNCKSHHMPLCLYCQICKEVCCVACVSVNIHKQHNDQVVSVVDIVNDERRILKDETENFEKLRNLLSLEQTEIQQILKNIDTNETQSKQKVDEHFDCILTQLQKRRNLLKQQLQDKFKICRDNLHAKRDDLKNITLTMDHCLEEARRVSRLNDFAALSLFKSTMEKMKRVELDSAHYHQHVSIPDSVPYVIDNSAILQTINVFGTVGVPETPSFIEEKCIASSNEIHMEWNSVENNWFISSYVLYIGENNNNFCEIYRGLETKYNATNLKSDTLYAFRLCVCVENIMGNPVLFQMKTSKNYNNWTLSMSGVYPAICADNTQASLLDEQFITGAATDSKSGQQNWIKATFPEPVQIKCVTIAPFHKNRNVWGPCNGNGGSLEYSINDASWIKVGTIHHIEMQQQHIETENITARYWRLVSSGYLGTSCFIFK